MTCRHVTSSRVTCYKYSITCQDDLLTVDNAQSHVAAFRPISEAACSWSDDNNDCDVTATTVQRHATSCDFVFTKTATAMQLQPEINMFIYSARLHEVAGSVANHNARLVVGVVVVVTVIFTCIA